MLVCFYLERGGERSIISINSFTNSCPILASMIVITAV